MCKAPSIPSLFDQLVGAAASAVAARAEAATPAWPMNPFQTGICSSSATDAVLRAMRGEPQRWWCHSQLVWRTGRGRGAVTWALAYLEQQGLIRSTPNAFRPPYQQYQSPSCQRQPFGAPQAAAKIAVRAFR